MLKTNSKKACENIRAYIVDKADGTNYDVDLPKTFEGVARWILGTFRKEYYSRPEDKQYFHNNEQAAFISWTQGLPSALDCCFWYNRPAVDDLGNILEQTEAQRNKYSEDAACKMLASLIYRELAKVA